MDTPATVIDKKVIEAWAQENPVRALELGKRLMRLEVREDLFGLESLGEFEDRATDWALENQMKARLLFLKLMPGVLAAIEKMKEQP
jgi:hypothetical protein